MPRLQEHDLDTLATKYSWKKMQIPPNNNFMISYKKVEISCRLNFYLSTGTVASCLVHPRKRATQLFRRSCSLDEAEDLFKDPRTHTGKGYYEREELESRPTPAPRPKPSPQSFLEYLAQFPEADVIDCENRSILIMHFQDWRSRQGTMKGLKFKECMQSLETQGKLRKYRHRPSNNDLYLFETRQGRILERIEFFESAEPTNANDRGTTNEGESGRNGQHISLNRELVERDKGGIEISRPIEFPCTRLGSESHSEVCITNRGTRTRFLRQVEFLGDTSPPSFSIPRQDFPLSIQPERPVRIGIALNPHSVGVSKALVAFTFDGFKILRYISGMCGDPDLQEHLKPSAAYKKKERRRPQPASRRTAVDGEKVQYGMPPYVRKMRAHPLIPTNLEDVTAIKSLPAGFDERNVHNYRLKHEGMLAVEESRLVLDLQEYNMDSAVLRRGGTYLVLAVPGLAEKRPSVLRGDAVICTHEGVDYIGYVHLVQQTDVSLKFHKRFHAMHIDGTRYNIQFVFPRRTMRILLQGLSFLAPSSVTAEKYHRMLFPCEAPRIADAPSLNSAGLNLYQRRAVDNIIGRIGSNLDISGASFNHNAPYVIFGPPGTGKTKTVVEAVLQACRLRRSLLKILVCAPSNTAADVLLSRLAPSLNQNELFRFMSFTRSRGEVSEKVHSYCNYDDGMKGYTCPSPEALNRYRVVVATCGMAGKLYNNGLAKDHFDVVVVDECGHAWESEVVASSSFPLKPNGILVLAGDPMQLGPVTHSDTDLKVSMLERIISRPIYARNDSSFPDTGGYNSSCVTKLLETYRCHPEIIKIPNELFYDNELIDRSGPEARSLLNWEYLPNRKFPLIFHGVAGENQREGNSPSWFNPSEVEQVLYYVQLLKEHARVLSSDIGIIAPYQKQVQKIRIGLRLKGYDDGIMVGSCEQFQGQEKRVIIISTVRTSKDLFAYDSKFNLGFVSNSKRMNVAITRAKALLIVVGEPAVLSEDRHWVRFLRHCMDNGAYTGVPFTERSDSSSDALAVAVAAADDDDDAPPYDGGETKEI